MSWYIMYIAIYAYGSGLESIPWLFYHGENTADGISDINCMQATEVYRDNLLYSYD